MINVNIFNPIVKPIFLLAEILSCNAYVCKGDFVPDQPCQCNLACQDFGDCCPDFFPVCLPGIIAVFTDAISVTFLHLVI